MSFYWRKSITAFAASQSLLQLSKCESFSDFQIDVETNQNRKIYNTAAHKELHRGLSYQRDALVKNRYKETNGSHSRLVQGPKGIGKSTMLKSFLNQKRDDKVISLYLSYDELLQTESVLKDNSILQLVDQELKKEGIYSSTITAQNMGERLAKALEANNKYIFLVVDEIDQLYRESAQNKSVYEVARTSLGDLAWLGNQKSGRFAVFLCGSSASCPLLVTCTGNADKQEFPLRVGAPNLNGQRYRTLRLSVTLLNNVKGMTNLLKEMGYNASEELARLMLFQVGLIPRSVHHHVECICAGETLTHQNTSSRHHESGFKASSGLPSLLYESLIKKLQSKNKIALSLLSDKTTGRLCQYKVASEKWETEIEPLNYEDIVEYWKRVCTDGAYESESENLQLLQQYIFGFCDHGKFSFESIDRGLPIFLYPVYGALIFSENIDTSSAQNFYATIDLLILEYLKRVTLKVEDKIIDKYT
mmetsp:Transcript_10963/g.17867  ORF Transcript_10963/g.17867 Transcript_10963/m.17867 type:complete len:475 (+) Transcript_10963:31-1455(+)